MRRTPSGSLSPVNISNQCDFQWMTSLQESFTLTCLDCCIGLVFTFPVLGSRLPAWDQIPASATSLLCDLEQIIFFSVAISLS